MLSYVPGNSAHDTEYDGTFMTIYRSDHGDIRMSPGLSQAPKCVSIYSGAKAYILINIEL